MSDTHNMLQYRNNCNYWKTSNLVLDLNYFPFSNPNPNPNPNPTYLPEHQILSLNLQFSPRIWYAGYYSAHAQMAWSQENSLDTGAQDSTVLSCLSVNSARWIVQRQRGTSADW